MGNFIVYLLHLLGAFAIGLGLLIFINFVQFLFNLF